MMKAPVAEPPCGSCKWRQKAEQKPGGVMARLWRWHTGWCPGWKRYQAWLATQEN